jgi:hypothetical protein
MASLSDMTLTERVAKFKANIAEHEKRKLQEQIDAKALADKQERARLEKLAPEFARLRKWLIDTFDIMTKRGYSVTTFIKLYADAGTTILTLYHDNSIKFKLPEDMTWEDVCRTIYEMFPHPEFNRNALSNGAVDVCMVL